MVSFSQNINTNNLTFLKIWSEDYGLKFDSIQTSAKPPKLSACTWKQVRFV